MLQQISYLVICKSGLCSHKLLLVNIGSGTEAYGLGCGAELEIRK